MLAGRASSSLLSELGAGVMYNREKQHQNDGTAPFRNNDGTVLFDKNECIRPFYIKLPPLHFKSLGIPNHNQCFPKPYRF